MSGWRAPLSLTTVPDGVGLEGQGIFLAPPAWCRGHRFGVASTRQHQVKIRQRASRWLISSAACPTVAESTPEQTDDLLSSSSKPELAQCVVHLHDLSGLHKQRRPLDEQS